MPIDPNIKRFKKSSHLSCIAGVRGDAKALTAKSRRDIIAIDGCPLSCCKSSLARHEVQPKHHFVLSDFDVPKINGGDPDPSLYISAYKRILELTINHS